MGKLHNLFTSLFKAINLSVLSSISSYDSSIKGLKVLYPTDLRCFNENGVEYKIKGCW